MHLLCGYNGAGKTTYARQLAETLPAVRFSLDEWMLRLYPDLAFDSPEYGERAETCKALIWDVARQILVLGSDVILDWNQWSRARRATWRDAAQNAGFDVVLHHIQTPVEVAITRADARAAQNIAGSHVLSENGIRHLASIFEPPSSAEGLQIVTVI